MRYQLYSHHQDEPPKAVSYGGGYEEFRPAKKKAKKLSKEPIIFGTVIVIDQSDGKHVCAYSGGARIY